MVENEIKRHDIFLIVFGIILGFADPITDILTLVEFYREDHKTWFGVGLTFVFLPCFVFLRTYYVLNKSELKKVSIARRCTQVILCAANPFFPAFLKLQTLFSYLKNFTNFWRGNKVSGIDSGNSDEEAHVDLLHQSNVALLFEGTLEAAPQFIIQLYAMVVQQESVTIVQMVSLPVSFLSLAWASVVVDEWIHSDEGDINFSVKDRVLLFVTHLFILSSRLFAVALFTVSYKWWVTSVLILHCTVITICDRVWLCSAQIAGDKVEAAISFFLHWLRDDLSLIGGQADYKELIMKLISNVLFVIENITMILLFYFSHFPHTWYCLLVTICVCVFAVLGAIMRLSHFYFLSKELNNNNDFYV